MPLTEKQARFAQAYRGDAKAAVIAAGYAGTDGSLKVMGSKLLRHPGVLAALKERGVRPRTLKSRRTMTAKGAQRGRKPAKTGPSTTTATPPARPPPFLAGLTEEQVLQRIVEDPGTKPLEQMRALQTLRDLREMAAADGQGEDLGDAPPGQTVAWVRNGRVPDPAPVVLDALLRLDPTARQWVLDVVRREGSLGEARPPWGDLDAGAGAAIAELDGVIGALGGSDLRRYVLEVLLRDAYAPPVVRARAAELHSAETEEGSGHE